MGSCSFPQMELVGAHVGLSLQKLEDKKLGLVLDKEWVQWECLDKKMQDMTLQLEGMRSQQV